MFGAARLVIVLVAVAAISDASLADAQDATGSAVSACISTDGALRIVDAAVACNPAERRVAVAIAKTERGLSDLSRNLVLLVATAITSGLVVPYVLGRVDYRRSEQARERQARITRESRVIDAQVRLLENLARVLWRWRYLVMKVTYYGIKPTTDQRYPIARREYDERVWGLLNRFRLEVSRAQRLTSKSVHAMLLDFYQLMVDTDNRIREIEEESEDTVKLAVAFADLNRDVFETVTTRIDAMLDAAAHEMKLVGAGVDRPPDGDTYAAG
jgi:hypothetical protein